MNFEASLFNITYQSTMSPNTSPIHHRDRADYMITYREKNGSGRDYTQVNCSCGKTVFKYNLRRHLDGVNHPPVPDLDLARRIQERKEAEQRDRLFREAQDRFSKVVTQLNTHLFVDVGESASSSDLSGKGLSLFDNNLSLHDSIHPQWQRWTQDFVTGLSSYYHCGPGMIVYQEHLKAMEKDHIYERKIERARRRLRVAVRRLRGRAIHVPESSNRIELPVELKAFLGKVDNSE